MKQMNKEIKKVVVKKNKKNDHFLYFKIAILTA